jgi:hypothetical protein
MLEVLAAALFGLAAGWALRDQRQRLLLWGRWATRTLRRPSPQEAKRLEILREQDQELLMQVPGCDLWLGMRKVTVCTECLRLHHRFALDSHPCGHCGNSSFYATDVLARGAILHNKPTFVRVNSPLHDGLRRRLVMKWGTQEQKDLLNSLDALTSAASAQETP